MPHDVQLGQSIKEFRHRLCMTQAQAARSAKIPLVSFSQAERGMSGLKTRKRVLAWMGRMERKAK